MKVSRTSVKAADRVKKRGVPQLVDALAAGKVSVSAAARIQGHGRFYPQQQRKQDIMKSVPNSACNANKIL